MPLYRDTHVGQYARLGIWQITEGLADLPVPSSIDLSAIGSEARRLEMLAVYALLHRMVGNRELLIDHDSTGRPVLPGMKVSISHTRGWAAIILSERKNVGIDIEYMSDRVSRVVDRFIRYDEEKDGLHRQLIHWSAKETIYKYFHAENLQYFEMRLQRFLPEPKGQVVVEDLKMNQSVVVDYEVNGEFVLTYAVER